MSELKIHVPAEIWELFTIKHKHKLTASFMTVRLIFSLLLFAICTLFFVILPIFETMYPNREFPSWLIGIFGLLFLLSFYMFFSNTEAILKKMVQWVKKTCYEIGGPLFLDVIIYALLIILSFFVLLAIQVSDIPETGTFWVITLINFVCVVYAVVMFVVKAFYLLQDTE